MKLVHLHQFSQTVLSPQSRKGINFEWYQENSHSLLKHKKAQGTQDINKTRSKTNNINIQSWVQVQKVK